MEMMGTRRRRVLLQPAYVIHRKSYRDTSLIVDLLTPQFGRVALVARGAKSARSRTGVVLQGFQPLLVSWMGAGELCTLTTVEAQARSLGLSGRSLICGLYINELLMRCLHSHHEPHIELFSCYDDVLRKLASDVEQSDRARQAHLREFELNLLEHLGYGLVFTTDVCSGDAILSNAHYDYQLDRGPVLQQGETWYGIKVSGKTLQSMAQKTLLTVNDPVVFREAKMLMRFIINSHIGSKPLMSRELLRGPKTVSQSKF